MTTTRKIILGIAAALVAVLLLAPTLVGTWAGKVSGAFVMSKSHTMGELSRKR